jgi:ribosomal protein S18 acetylase RimI-like enzyme
MKIDDSLEIRPIAPDELDDVLAVYELCEDFLALGPVTKASMQMVAKDIEVSQNEGSRFCGIYENGKMIGVVDYARSGYEGESRHACLYLLMIAQPYRGQGIGQEVVDAVEADIRQNPEVTAIISGVQVNNPQAIQFWRRNGYEITSGPDLMPDQTVVFHLRKRIVQDKEEGPL